MSKTRLMQACAGVALAIGMANTASAGLTIELRLPTSASADPKTINVTNATAGTKIPIEVFAVVTGSAAGIEGFQSAQGAFLSNREPAGGGPAGQLIPAGDVEEVTFTEIIPALSPFTGSGATRGASKEVGPPDGVMDLGDEVRRGNSLGDLVAFRSPSLQVTSGAVIPNGREYKIGRIEFELSDLSVAGTTEINFAFRQNADGSPRAEAALFRADNVSLDGLDDIAVGDAVSFVVVPEPATIGLAAVGALGLLARRRK